MINIRKNNRTLWVTIAIIVLFIGAGSYVVAYKANEEAPPAISEEHPEDTVSTNGNIVRIIQDNSQFSIFSEGLDATGLDEIMSSDGPFTLFAPTDTGFSDTLESLGINATELLDQDDLLSMLSYHIVAGSYSVDDLKGLIDLNLETVHGASVSIAMQNDTLLINDSRIIKSEVSATNGVVHVIDAALIPPKE